MTLVVPRTTWSDLHLRQEGCAGDGVTDDTAALNAIVAKAMTTGAVHGGNYASGGRKIIVDPGTYLYNGQVTFPDRIDVEGAGLGVSAFLAGTPTAQLSVGAVPGAKPSAGVGSRRSFFGGFTVDGAGITTGAPFRVNVAVQTSFQGMEIRNSLSDGALIWGAQNCAFEEFNCESNGNPLTNLGSSLILDAGAGNNTFTKCEIADGVEYDLKIIQTVSQRQGAGTNPNANLFSRCLFERVNQGQHGCAYLGAGDQNSFEYCHFQFPAALASSVTTIRHDNLFGEKSQRWTFHNCFWQGSLANTTAIDILGSIPYVFFTGENYLQNHAIGVLADSTSGLYGLQNFHTPDNVTVPNALHS